MRLMHYDGEMELLTSVMPHQIEYLHNKTNLSSSLFRLQLYKIFTVQNVHFNFIFLKLGVILTFDLSKLGRFALQ